VTEPLTDEELEKFWGNVHYDNLGSSYCEISGIPQKDWRRLIATVESLKVAYDDACHEIQIHEEENRRISEKLVDANIRNQNMLEEIEERREDDQTRNG